MCIADWRPVDHARRLEFCAPRYSLELVRERLVSTAPPGGPGTLVYVSRNDSNTRRVANEHALLQELRLIAQSKQLELVVVNAGPNSVWSSLGPLVPKLAARIFSSAHAVVGPHGSGLANTMFCREGTMLLEFTLENQMLFYTHISAALSLRHRLIQAQKVGKAAGALRGDLVVNITEVVQRLKRGLL